MFFQRFCLTIQRLRTYSKENLPELFYPGARNLFFQKKLDERYKAEWLKQLLENQGSEVVYLDNNPPKTEQELKEEVIKAWEEKYDSLK